MSSSSPVPGRRLMKFLWGLLGLALLLMITPAVVGSFLSSVYEGSAVRHFSQSPEEVWAEVADHESHPLHGSSVKGVNELDPENGLPAWEEVLAHSSAYITTLEEDPPRLVRRKSENLKDTLTVLWTCTITPQGGGCDVKVEQRIEVTGSGWFGANLRFWMTFLGEANRGVARYLELLGASLEGGSAR